MIVANTKITHDMSTRYVVGAVAAAATLYFLYTRRRNKLQVTIATDKEELGRKAALHAASKIRAAVAAQNCARVIFATGASQFEFLQELVSAAKLETHKPAPSSVAVSEVMPLADAACILSLRTRSRSQGYHGAK